MARDTIPAKNTAIIPQKAGGPKIVPTMKATTSTWKRMRTILTMEVKMRLADIIRKGAALALAIGLAWAAPADAASLLPQGDIQFTDDNGNPLSAGTVETYIPNTTTPKTTWLDQNQASANTNPINLDAGGRAIIWGDGAYRMIVKDANGVTISDLITVAPGTDLNGFDWGGTSAGAPNAQTVTASGFDGSDGAIVTFMAGLTNTGGMTVQTTNFAATPVRKDLPGGPVALTGGEVRAGNVVMLMYDSGLGVFHLINQPDPFGGEAIAGVTAAAITDVLGSNGTVVNIVGTGVTITSLGTAPNRFKIGYFTAANTITANATTLITPGGGDINAAAGDSFGVISDASGNARIVWYQGQSVDPFDPAIDNQFTAAQTITIGTSGSVLNGVSTDAGASSGPNIDLYRDSATPAASDGIGAVIFRGEDSGGNATTYGSLAAAIADPTDASEDATIRLGLMSAGASIVPWTLVGTTSTYTSTDPSASPGPIMLLSRASESPVAFDLLGEIDFTGRDSGGSSEVYGLIRSSISDPTAGSEDGAMTFATPVAGAFSSRMTIGGGVYHPSATGGDKGNNTINFGTVYQNNQQVYSAGGTDVAVADGGTGASTAAAARSNLGAKNGKDAAFRAIKTSNQAMSAGATVKLSWVEQLDTGGFFASDTWTPPAGPVSLSAAIEGTAASSEDIMIWIDKDGTPIQGAETAVTGGGSGISVEAVDVANGSNSYTVWARFTGAGNVLALDRQVGIYRVSYFQGYMIGGP